LSLDFRLRGQLRGPRCSYPPIFAVLVILLEVVGWVALIFGLFTRLFAVPLAIILLIAALLVHFPNGFFSRDGGYEYTLVLMVGCVALALSGLGKTALDRVLAARSDAALANLLR
jgi:putative oxidoreductase